MSDIATYAPPLTARAPSRLNRLDRGPKTARRSRHAQARAPAIDIIDIHIKPGGKVGAPHRADQVVAQPVESGDIAGRGERNKPLEVRPLDTGNHRFLDRVTLPGSDDFGRQPLPKSSGGPTGERQRANPSLSHGVRLSLSASTAGQAATKPAAIKVPGSAIHAASPIMAPLVEAALAAAIEPQSARDIHTAIGCGSISTVRGVLRGIAAEGRATVEAHAIRHGNSVNRYRHIAPHEAAS